MFLYVIFYVITYLKGGAIELKTAQTFEKPFSSPSAGSYYFSFSFKEFQLEWLFTGNSR